MSNNIYDFADYDPSDMQPWCSKCEQWEEDCECQEQCPNCDRKLEDCNGNCIFDEDAPRIAKTKTAKT